jgi:hypothetical protein
MTAGRYKCARADGRVYMGYTPDLSSHDGLSPMQVRLGLYLDFRV